VRRAKGAGILCTAGCAALACGYENPAFHAVSNGEWANAKTTLRKNIFKNSCN
jgi:hypothetical protein